MREMKKAREQLEKKDCGRKRKVGGDRKVSHPKVPGALTVGRRRLGVGVASISTASRPSNAQKATAPVSRRSRMMSASRVYATLSTTSTGSFNSSGDGSTTPCASGMSTERNRARAVTLECEGFATDGQREE
eukprot:6173386-Pleurochrysis_carterae.AAC.2